MLAPETTASDPCTEHNSRDLYATHTVKVMHFMFDSRVINLSLILNTLWIMIDVSVRPSRARAGDCIGGTASAWKAWPLSTGGTMIPLQLSALCPVSGAAAPCSRVLSLHLFLELSFNVYIQELFSSTLCQLSWRVPRSICIVPGRAIRFHS